MTLLKKARNYFGLGRHTVDTPISQAQANVRDKKTGVRPALHTGAPPSRRAQLNERAAADAGAEMRRPATASIRAEAAETPAPPADLVHIVDAHFAGTPQAYLSKSLLRNAVRDLESMMPGEALNGSHAVWQSRLVECLAEVTGADASRSVAALAALRSFDPLRDIAEAVQQIKSPRSVTDPATCDAWRVMSMLSTNAEKNPLTSAMLCKSVPAAQEGNFATYLKSAADIFRMPGKTLPLASVLRRAIVLSGDAGKEVANSANRKTDPNLALISTMESADPDLHALVENHYGHVSQEPGCVETLVEALRELATVVAHAAPRGLPGTPQVLLTQALAAVTEGDAARSLATLSALRRLDPIQDIAAAWRQRDDYVAPLPESSDAWRVAKELVATPSGLDVLQAVFAKAVPEEHRRNFALLLKAVGALPAGSDQVAAPLDALRREDLSGSVAGQAVICAAARLSGDPATARPFDWALGAVRNDLYDLGIASEFAAIEARVLKMGRWIDRASRDRAVNIRNPITGKSAFRAMRHGTQQVERGPAIAKHRAAFDRILRNAAQHLRDRLSEQAPFARAGGPRRVPEELVRTAVLDHCLALPGDTCIDRYQLGETALNDIASRLSCLVVQLGGGRGNAPTDTLSERFSPQVKALAGTTMSMELLKHWTKEAQKTSASSPIAREEDSSWGDAIHGNLEKARQEAYGRDTRLSHVTREELRKSLKEVVAHMEGSSRLRLTSGGVFGVGLRQITATLSALASALFVRGKIDARKQWGRHAVFEMAMTTYDMEIVIGTQRQRATQLGGGASVGVNLGIAKAGGGVDVLAYGKETSDVEGISLRIPRVGLPIGEVRAEFSKLVDRLLDGTTRAAVATQDSLLAELSQESLLKALLQEFPTLTVNRIGDAGDGRTRHGVTVEGGGNVKAPFVRATATAGASLEFHSSTDRHYKDATGDMRVVRQMKGWAARGTVGAKLSAGLQVKEKGVSFTSGNTDLQLGASLEVLAAGGTHRREEVYRDGRLQPVSFVEHEHQSIDSFANEVAPKIDTWSKARAARGVGRDVETEKANLKKFLHEVRQQATPSHSFSERNMIAPEAVARINALRSSQMLAQRQPAASNAGATKEMSAAFDGVVEAEWSNPEVRKPFSLRSYKRVSNQTTRGLNAVAQIGAQHSADGVHIDNRYDVA